jgi:competence protein ComFA
LIKSKIYRVIVTTSILERGITLEGLNVIVYNANHKVFDHQCLIQISGRVGRKKTSPIGEIILLTNKYNDEIKKAILDIQNSNSLIDHDFVQNM